MVSANLIVEVRAWCNTDDTNVYHFDLAKGYASALSETLVESIVDNHPQNFPNVNMQNLVSMIEVCQMRLRMTFNQSCGLVQNAKWTHFNETPEKDHMIYDALSSNDFNGKVFVRLVNNLSSITREENIERKKYFFSAIVKCKRAKGNKVFHDTHLLPLFTIDFSTNEMRAAIHEQLQDGSEVRLAKQEDVCTALHWNRTLSLA